MAGKPKKKARKTWKRGGTPGSADFAELGIARGPAQKAAVHLLRALLARGLPPHAARGFLAAVAATPEAYAENPEAAELAKAITEARGDLDRFHGRAAPAPYERWGEGLEPESVRQMESACQLPVAVRGALMPDAHVGYGLPIGGVLATRDAVIPYAVGVDIACRMKLTVLDVPPSWLERDEARLVRALEGETRFGMGASFEGRTRRQHAVMDEDWRVTPLAAGLKDKAWAQLGTSGSGNHFVELGTLTLARPDLHLEPGTYLALLSHSGSRGAGATIASHYSRLAMYLHSDLPGPLKHLAWLDLQGGEGEEYWAAMELMGRYAAANHDCIHRAIARALGARVLADIENHHNFAWREVHDGEELIVHRKGATPAGRGVLGIIPGSMATHAFVVRGRGEARSLRSASHGAGRAMSRTEARKRFNWHHVRGYLAERGVKLLSAGIDEVPMAYKDIDKVMAEQRDLVDVVATFQPRLVKMAPEGERPED